MKKILALLLGGGLTLSMTACAGPYDGDRHHHRHHDHWRGMNGPSRSGPGMGSPNMNNGPGRQGSW
ncbi:hypothetical protein [Gluconobacter kanchanaburiensis]|uniref:Lipoprotein n=1 Tax=Gluconobacter kanchanaburiensis NBRC 103587 TaxID=1307948 RepID=A0A511B702_9PROT|nr:hypothetical protein [Gluconobacter kanchanaburiensis]MBF0860550.1 hypothetical protein [Gluconobacter kanchanaburiensis]GEK96199.1 hypothetical protein GKA01_13960 [Gluconobacter kanchanaburiensis NBRC 103587]